MSVTINQYGHEVVTIQLTLGKDDILFLQEIADTSEDTGICQHIVEQYNAVKTQGETA